VASDRFRATSPDTLASVVTPAVISLDDVPARETEEGDIAFSRRRLGPVAGTRRIGASWYAVPAGRRGMPVHVHGDEEEIFWVLEGGGLAWQRGEACEVAAGDTVVHPPNGRPHTFIAGDQGLRLLAFGSGSESGLTFLPRAGVMWAGPRWVPLDSPHPFRAEGLAGPLEAPAPGDRAPNVVALDAVAEGRLPGVRSVGAAAGSVRAGLNHVTLEPGASGAPAHVHTLEEELFFVLAGSGTLTLGSDEHPLTAGDIVARPPARSGPVSTT